MKIENHINNFEPIPSEASIKIDERSEFRVAFAFRELIPDICKKLPQRTERKRSSIEFERSENQGQFLKNWAFNYFNTFKCFYSYLSNCK